MGLLGTKAFLCLLSVICKEPAPASMIFLVFQRAVQTAEQSRKGGDAQPTEEKSRINSAALGQGPGSAFRDIFELFCRTKNPNKWKTLTT